MRNTDKKTMSEAAPRTPPLSSPSEPSAPSSRLASGLLKQTGRGLGIAAKSGLSATRLLGKAGFHTVRGTWIATRAVYASVEDTLFQMRGERTSNILFAGAVTAGLWGGVAWGLNTAALYIINHMPAAKNNPIPQNPVSQRPVRVVLPATGDNTATGAIPAPQDTVLQRAAPPMEDEPALTPQFMIVSGSRVNLRRAPNTDNRPSAKFRDSACVMVGEEGAGPEGFVSVIATTKKGRTRSGYVDARYLRPADETVTAENCHARFH